MNEANLDSNRVVISPKDIPSKIWTSPKAVFQFITVHNYDRYTILLLLLSGIAKTFDKALEKNLGDSYSLWGVLLYCVIVGSLFGWIGYYIYAALVSWTGKLFNANGSTQSILRVIAYSSVPSILAMALLIPQIVFFGNAFFQSNEIVSDTDLFGAILFYFSLVLQLILNIWSFLLFVIGVSIVQKLSILKALLNIILPALLFVSILFFIFLIV